MCPPHQPLCIPVASARAAVRTQQQQGPRRPHATHLRGVSPDAVACSLGTTGGKHAASVKQMVAIAFRWNVTQIFIAWKIGFPWIPQSHRGLMHHLEELITLSWTFLSTHTRRHAFPHCRRGLSNIHRLKVTINLASHSCGDGDGWLIFPQKAHSVVDARKVLYSISQPGIRFAFIQRHESICFCLVVPLGSEHNKGNGIWVGVELMTFCHSWYGVDSTKGSSPPFSSDGKKHRYED